MIDLGAVSDVSYYAIGAVLCVVGAVLLLIQANQPATVNTQAADEFSRKVADRCLEYRHSAAVTQASMGDLHEAGERLKGSIQRWTA